MEFTSLSEIWTLSKDKGWGGEVLSAIFSPRLSFFLPHLHRGGMERVTVSLIKGLTTLGFSIDLVLINRGVGAYEEDIPKECRIIDLRARRALTAIPALIRYLKETKPKVLITASTHVNVAALLARAIARTRIPIIVTEHSNFSTAHPHAERKLTSKLLPPLMRLFYPRASFIVGVSQGCGGGFEKGPGL